MESKSFDITYDNKIIKGDLFIPDNLVEKEEYPIVIIAHGFGGNRHRLHQYVPKLLSKGYALYTFDFCGGGKNSESSGTMADMSVLTEAQDLKEVIKLIKALPQCKKIALLGCSQGGFVSSYVANDLRDDIEGLILYYPAYVLQHDAKIRFDNTQEIPDTYEIMGNTIGKKYYYDALSFDIYNHLVNYDKPVLICHGSDDPIVPTSYVQKAVNIYNNCEFHLIDGAGHGFDDDAEDIVINYTVNYLNRIGF